MDVRHQYRIGGKAIPPCLAGWLVDKPLVFGRLQLSDDTEEIAHDKFHGKSYLVQHVVGDGGKGGGSRRSTDREGDEEGVGGRVGRMQVVVVEGICRGKWWRCREEAEK